jgi:hypothetical protein
MGSTLMQVGSFTTLLFSSPKASFCKLIDFRPLEVESLLRSLEESMIEGGPLFVPLVLPVEEPLHRLVGLAEPCGDSELVPKLSKIDALSEQDFDIRLGFSLDVGLDPVDGFGGGEAEHDSDIITLIASIDL